MKTAPETVTTQLTSNITINIAAISKLPIFYGSLQTITRTGLYMGLSIALLACGNSNSTQSTVNQKSHTNSEQTVISHDHQQNDTANHHPKIHDGMNHKDMTGADMNAHEPAPALGQDYSIYQIGGNWTDQHGNHLQLDQLKGKNQVLVMAYTSCQHTCPILVRAMKQIEKEMTPAARAKTEFVLATLDTQRDTSAVMKNYAEHNALGDNWRLIRSDTATTRMLANTLNIKYKFADNGDINHSNLISILDTDGRLVAQEIGVADSGIKPLINYLNTHST